MLIIELAWPLFSRKSLGARQSMGTKLAFEFYPNLFTQSTTYRGVPKRLGSLDTAEKVIEKIVDSNSF